MSDFAIKVEGLSKVYKLYDKPIDRMKESLHPLRKRYHRDFFALNDISVEIEKGETIGIIGKNGSGKSTLLKILTGVLTPTSGKVEVNGRVSALLELGAGFNPEFTGLENVYFNGSIMGYSREQIDAKIDDILSFADIGDFINQPVKMYSSGMFVRLAFSVATQVDPDILIVDEALSVGDMFFQAKCMTRMNKLITNEGVTLFFVSHSLSAVKSLCKKGILLNEGLLTKIGTSDEVAEKYFAMSVSSRQETIQVDDNLVTLQDNQRDLSIYLNSTESFLKKSTFGRIQNGKADFVNVVLLDENGLELPVVKYGQKVTLRMVVKFNDDILEVGCGYHIRDGNGVDVIYGGSSIENKRLKNVKAGEFYVYDWSFTLQLMHGLYSVAAVCSIPINVENSEVEFCDFIPIAVQFEMQRRYPEQIYGFVYLENKVNVSKICE